MRELEILYEALNSTHGIEVEFMGNFQSVLARLYSARKTDPDLEILQVCRSPVAPETHLWITKREATAPQQLKPNPQGDGELFSLADLFGDE